ncbi:amidohydrolase [Helicobacter jaachi]|uniref:Amidohydrolase n=1 Tax=Helicobacter jaachi TaxID=1677920 RepID=A0A4U8TAL8_9HELI|nr:M20 family metallopeptidase [Helicobacter jaachi]TLD96901.1 amidohydrolase [Helicobacter jaachi]
MQGFNIHPSLLALQTLGIGFRHALHKIPESSGQEFKTAAFCKDILEKCGFIITPFAGCTGFVADMEADSINAPRVAIRADMDALEMEDLTTDEHCSTHKGLAHNCGHDLHMAIALLSAHFIAEHRDKLPCNVRFIFQMAEEKSSIPGADKMVELGCMQGVDEVYALHNDGSLEYGSVHINKGVMSSFGTIWRLDIEGKAAHGSTPHKGLDAVREGGRILADMDYVVAKQINPFSHAVFSCGMFHGGSIPNGVAESATLQGTIRAMDKHTDEILKNALKDIQAQSRARGFNVQLHYDGYPAMINHPLCAQKIIDAAKKCLKNHTMLIESCEPMSASEDFSYMINAAPEHKGAMYFLGSGNVQKGICNYLHANPYYVEDRAVIVGAQIWINLIFGDVLDNKL